MCIDSPILIKHLEYFCSNKFYYDTYEKILRENKLKKINRPQSEKKIQVVFDAVKKNPDILCFGNDIVERDCEYIIQLSEPFSEKEIQVEKSSRWYDDMKLYLRIGKKWY